MIKIRMLSDIQTLKRDEHLPYFYIEEINNQFLWSYEAENDGEDIDSFSLPAYACIYHFNHESDWQMLQKLVNEIEYVETEVVDGVKYFRIGIMQDHEMSVIYFIEGVTL